MTMSITNFLLVFVLPLVVLAWVACGIYGFWRTYTLLRPAGGKQLWWRYAAALGVAILVGPFYLFNPEIGTRIITPGGRAFNPQRLDFVSN